jgi:hypothetical protein
VAAWRLSSSSTCGRRSTFPPGCVSPPLSHPHIISPKITQNGTPWVLNAELFDTDTRALGQASAAANNWFWNFIVSRFTPQMFLTMRYGVYFFFAALMVLSIPFVWFLVPETKGVPLECIGRLFEVRNASTANRVVMVELRAEAARRGEAEKVADEEESEKSKEGSLERLA